jgi:hypothetical protein
MEVYLANAYRQQASLLSRTANYFQNTDRAALQAIIARLPVAHASLTEPLTSDNLRQWIDTYHAGLEGMSELVIAIRALEN